MISFFINFATEKYSNSQRINCDTAMKDGFNIVSPFVKEHINGFWEKHLNILDPDLNGGLPNGGCLWKPFIIAYTLKYHMQYNDYLVYSDCGDKINLGLRSFCESKLTDCPYLFVENVHNHRDYTKQECFDLMGCASDYYYHANQLEAGLIAVRKNSYTVDFIDEWLEWCKKPEVILDHTVYPVVRHSRDQSILTNLVLKQDMKTVSIHEILGLHLVEYNVYD